MNFTRFFLVFAALCAMPSAAMADPISALITAISGFAASSALAGFLVDMAISFALSALSVALSGKSDARRPGIKTEATTSGGDNPQSFVIGRYATAGNMVAPPYSHPNSGDLPNKFLTYVIDLADMAGLAFSRLMVNGQYVTDLQAHSGDHDFEGIFKDNKPHLFMTFHDGNQSVADAYMLANYSDYPERPWSADMVGTGVSYMVLTFKFERELFSSLPTVRAEIDGIPLYDPRFDDTAGGTGAQRWADPSTWQFSANPAVMIYNILRGISLPDGKVWGGSVAAEDLPTDTWFTAMNECDFVVTNKDGSTRPQYQAGFEISVDMRPADVIDELAKACSAQLVELGGVYKIRVGAPALPSMFITDDDIIADEPEEFTPYPGMEGVYNAIHASYPDPSALWEAKEAPAIYNAEWEADDDGRQLVANVDLPAAPFPQQVQQLMAAWIKDARRFAQHTLSLPPEAAILEPLDTVGWTSAENGYSAEVFEISGQTDDLQLCNQAMRLRSRAVGDFAWVPVNDEVDVSYPSILVPANHARTVLGWGVSASAILDTAGQPRLPGLRLTWDGTATDDATALHYQIRPAGQSALVAEGDTSELTAGELVVSSGLLPDTDYETRAIWVSARDGDWSAWVSAKTDNVRLDLDDLDPSVNGAIDAAAASAAADKADAAASAASAGADKLAAEAAALLADADRIAAEGAATAAASSETLSAKSADVAFEAAGNGGTGNLVLYHHAEDAETGTGWASCSDDQVTGSPSGAPALSLTDGARVKPNHRGDMSGRRIRVTGWFNTQGSANAVSIRMRGGSNETDGGLISNAAIGPVAAGLDWHFVSLEGVITATTEYWAPAFDLVAGTDVVLVSDLKWEDITESAAAEDHANQAEVHKDAAATSEANAAGSASLAATSETLVAKSSNRVQLQSAGNMLGREFFDDDEKDPWTSGTIITVSGHPNGKTKALQQNARDLYSEQYQGDIRNRTYRVRGVVDASNALNDARVGFRLHDPTPGNTKNSWPTTLAAPAGQGPTAFDVEVTTNNPSGDFSLWQFFLQSNGFSDYETHWSELHYEDITESKAAEAQAAQAEVHKNSAASSETNAAGSAAAAATSESVSASHATDAEDAANRAQLSRLDATFEQGISSVTSSHTGDPLTRADATDAQLSVIASDDIEVGGNTMVGAGDARFCAKHAVPIDINRKYRMRARVRRVSAASGSDPRLYIGYRCLKADYNSTAADGNDNQYVVASNFKLAQLPVSSDYVELVSGVLTGDRDNGGGQFRFDTVYVRPLAYLNYQSTDTGDVIHLSGWWFEDITESEAAKAEAEIAQTAVAATDGKLAASIGMRTVAGTSGAELELVAMSDPENGDVSAARIRADNIIFDGSVFSDHMGVENLAAVTSKLGNVTVDEKLTLGEDAGFLSGRPDRVSYEDDGFFVGATKKSDGQRGFEISHTHKDNYDRLAGIVHSEETGFQVFNPRFLVGAKDGAAVNNSIKYASSGTYNIGSGRKELTLFVVGGGGAGGYGLSGGSGSGSAASGGTTSVEVYAGVPGSGGVKIGSTISASGGAGGLNAPSSGSGYTGTPGGNSSFGQGGAGGAPNTIGGDAASTAYGAGGGGAGGDAPSTFDSSGRCGFGGAAGQDKTVTIDLSAHEGSNIHLVVTIGGQGNGSGGSYRGGNGRKGIVAVADALSGYKEVDGHALYDNMITSLAKTGAQTIVIGDGADELGPFTDNRLYIIGRVISSSTNNDYRIRQIDATPRRWIISMEPEFSIDELRTNTSNNGLDTNFASPTGMCWVFLPAGGIQSWDGSSRTMTWENYSEIKDISEDMAREIIAKLQ